MGDELDTEGAAAELRFSLRTTQRYVAAWAEAQHRPDVPRVRLDRTGPGRPGYRIDVATLRQWRLQMVASNTDGVPTANDAPTH